MKKVKCVETGIVYDSLNEAAKAVGLKSSGNISVCCYYPSKRAKGFHWEFVEEGADNDNQSNS